MDQVEQKYFLGNSLTPSYQITPRTLGLYSTCQGEVSS